jgi:aminoacylase
MAPPESESFDESVPSTQMNNKMMKLARVDLDAVESEAAIGRFVEFLKFPTVSALAVESGAYIECAQWLKEQLEASHCFDQVFLLPEAPDHSPVVIAKIIGIDESLPILLLNSHYDVVPANPNDWTLPPFQGLRKEGKIYGRGTQDMKCVCMQYFEGTYLRRGPRYL